MIRIMLQIIPIIHFIVHELENIGGALGPSET